MYFISLSDYIYFYHIELGEFVYQVKNGGLSEANIFPHFQNGIFNNEIFYLQKNSDIFLYRLNKQSELDLIDSLINRNENQYLEDFDILGNNIVQGFWNPFELKALRYLENSGEFLLIDSFQNYNSPEHIDDIC